jgi:phosphatidylglycerol:prolipoprotein diacylglycerol transferase
MTFYSPGSIFIHLGPIIIRYYGIMYLLGFLLATMTLRRLAARFNVELEPLFNCALVCFLSGIIGARIYYVLLSLPYFANNILEIPAIWHGGMSIHGGIIGSIIGSIIYCKQKHLPVLATGDLLGTVVPLAQAIGRWGNFFNNELFGLPVPASFTIKQYIPPEMRPERFASFEFFQPAFFYESVWDFILFLTLYFIVLPKCRRYPGVTFFIYVSGYSLGRILIEPIRVDSIMLGSIQIPLIASWVFLFLSLFGIGTVWMRYKFWLDNLH